MFSVSALLLDDTLLKCIVTEVVLFSIVAFKTLIFHKVVYRNAWGVVASLVRLLLQYMMKLRRTKQVYQFLGYSVYKNSVLFSQTVCLICRDLVKVKCRIAFLGNWWLYKKRNYSYQMFNVSALLLDDALLKCVVTEVDLFSIVALNTQIFYKVV